MRRYLHYGEIKSQPCTTNKFLNLQNLKSHLLPYDVAVSNMNKSDKKTNEKTTLKVVPANTKVLPFDDGSKIKKKVK
jgi:hypothetical protein